MSENPSVPPLSPDPLPRGDVDPPDMPKELRRHYGVRRLNPAKAARLAGRPRPRVTEYIADRLIVPYDVWVDPEFREALGSLGWASDSERTARQEELALAAQLAERRVAPGAPVTVRLVPADDVRVAAPANAWTVLQELRQRLGQAVGERGARIGIEHVLRALPHSGHPVGDPASTLAAAPGYIVNGQSRMPLAVVFPQPLRRDVCSETTRRPVVAVLDTGCGNHPWLPPDDPTVPESDRIVDRRVRCQGLAVGDHRPGTDPEGSGDRVGPLNGGLDHIAGHGTFIAGLIRQTCPDAQILAIRVIRADGVILESELNLALAQLLSLAADHVDGKTTGRPVDVINLSLGYYHEDPDDLAYDGPLRALTDGFGRLGIPVIAAAGNESTTRPSFPAAFGGPKVPRDPQVLPVVSVGALNPDDTVAVFSNSGDWVTHWAPGTAVVSTLPVTFSGGLSPVVSLADPQHNASGTPFARADLDPDGYGGGFGLWSGTSFSAPIVAGMIAAALLEASEDGSHPLQDLDPRVCLARGRNAVDVVTRRCPEPATQRT